MTERGFHPFAVLHFLRKTILLYLLPLLQVLFARNWAALRTALVQGAALLQSGCMIPAQHRHIFTKTAAHDADGPAAAKQQIDGQTEDRKQQNQNDPRNFIRGVDMQPIYTQRNQKCQYRRAYLNGGGVVVQLEGKPEDP